MQTVWTVELYSVKEIPREEVQGSGSQQLGFFYERCH